MNLSVHVDFWYDNIALYKTQHNTGFIKHIFDPLVGVCPFTVRVLVVKVLAILVNYYFRHSNLDYCTGAIATW